LPQRDLSHDGVGHGRPDFQSRPGEGGAQGGLTIVGSGNYKAWVLPKVLDLLVRTRDKYPFDKLVSHKFKLEDVNEGIQLSIEGKVIRAGVVPG